MPMLKSLYWKLTLAFMLVAFITAALVAVFIRATSAERLMQLIIDQQRTSMEESLADYYSANGSWTGVDKAWLEIHLQAEPTPVVRATSDEFFPPPDQPAPDQPTPDRNRRNLFGLADAQGVVIVSVDPKFPKGATLPADVLSKGIPIEVDGVSVGTLLPQLHPAEFNTAGSLFLQRTNQALMLAILSAVLLALILGILLARTLTRPLHELTQAAQNIAQGELEQQVKVHSQDEIGQLASAFNRMSQEVARVNQLRRQMTADIAHDLRTPLTVIAGYVESMRDGILAPTTQRLALIYGEIERLQNLVGDLRMLSQVDAGELPLNPQCIAPKGMLERAAALFQYQAEQQEVSLSVEASDDLPEVRIDEARMMQVMHNLLSNALRYTPAGGKLRLSARTVQDKVEITVQDTGSGIDPQEMPYIFDRFHRADKSRHTETGESGLGLAIVKALIEAHGGKVWAELPPDGGTAIRFELPVPSDHSK